MLTLKKLLAVLFSDEIVKPDYFVSKKLAGPELNYPTLHKVVLALVHLVRQL